MILSGRGRRLVSFDSAAIDSKRLWALHAGDDAATASDGYASSADIHQVYYHQLITINWLMFRGVWIIAEKTNKSQRTRRTLPGLWCCFVGDSNIHLKISEKRITIMMPWSKPTHSRNPVETLCHHLDGLIPYLVGCARCDEAMEANTDCRKRVECFQWGGFNPLASSNTRWRSNWSIRQTKIFFFVSRSSAAFDSFNLFRVASFQTEARP